MGQYQYVLHEKGVEVVGKGYVIYLDVDGASTFCSCPAYRNTPAPKKPCKHMKDYAESYGESTLAEAPAPVAPVPDPVIDRMTYEPMLCQSSRAVPLGNGWRFEIKWDGNRCVAYVDGDKVGLRLRSGRWATADYPELVDALRRLERRVVLDGEIVVMDDRGWPSFPELQKRLQTHKLASFVAFDVLEHGDVSYIDQPYRTRREVLDRLFPETVGKWVPAARISQSATTTNGELLLKSCVDFKLEGIVAKRMQSVYQPGRRSPDWMKVKVPQRRAATIIGWTPGTGSREGRIGALILADEKDGVFQYCGKAGTGVTEADLKMLQTLLEPLRRSTAPVTVPKDVKAAAWLEPTVVVEVEFAELSEAGMMRFPSFKRVLAGVK